MNGTWYLRHFLGETNVKTAPGSGVFLFTLNMQKGPKVMNVATVCCNYICVK